MNCHICHSFGHENEAVAVCNECGAGVCQEHLEDAIVAARRERLHLLGCSHAVARTDRDRRERAHLAAAPSHGPAGAEGQSRDIPRPDTRRVQV